MLDLQLPPLPTRLKSHRNTLLAFLVLLACSWLVAVYTLPSTGPTVSQHSGHGRRLLAAATEQTLDHPACRTTGPTLLQSLPRIGSGSNLCGANQTGEWRNDSSTVWEWVWVPQGCSYSDWDMQRAQACFANRTIALIGDSHTRNLYLHMSEFFQAHPSSFEGNKTFHIHGMDFTAHNPVTQTTLQHFWSPSTATSLSELIERGHLDPRTTFIPDYLYNRTRQAIIREHDLLHMADVLVVNYPQWQHETGWKQYDLNASYSGHAHLPAEGGGGTGGGGAAGPTKPKAVLVALNHLPLHRDNQAAWEAHMQAAGYTVFGIQSAYLQATGHICGHGDGRRQKDVSQGMHTSGLFNQMMVSQILSAAVAAVCPCMPDVSSG